MPLSKDAQQNIELLKKRLRTEENFDLIYRTIRIADRLSCLFFIDGLIKDDIMEKILEFFYSVEKPEDLADEHAFAQRCVPYIEVDLIDDLDKLETVLLSGVLVLVVDGFSRAIAIDARTYPQRETSEPEKDKTLRGSRDGFVETLVANTALIRRRIRSRSLTMEIHTVGELSRTDVVVCYMKDQVDRALLQKITDKLQSVRIDSLTMNQQSLVEAIYQYKWYNPFPKFKYTERPDTAASAVLEGNIVLLVDNSPSAIILPTSIFDLIEQADDYYFPPLTGTYLRLSRYVIMLMTLLITPLWLLALQNPEALPEGLRFLLIEDEIHVPVILQLLLLELAIDGLRLASLNTPNVLTTSLSIIGAVILGDFAVQSGWFSPQSLVYMAFVGIANYSQPSLELGYSLKFMRMLLLILTALFNYWGFAAGLVLIFVLLALNKTFSGKSYLYPLIPFHGRALVKKLFRTRLSQNGR